MRSWKRRSRSLRKIQKNKWFMRIYLDNDVGLLEAYRRYEKNERRKTKLFKQIGEEVRKRAEGKTHYEDCFYHPCLLTVLDIPEDDIEGISLIDGTSPRSCSVLNCGVEFFTKEEAEARAAYIKEHGWDKYFEVYDTFGVRV